MKSNSSPSVVTITDSNYVLAVYILVASLRYHRVNCRINVLGVDLSALEKRLLEQFESTEVIDGESSNRGNATTRKAEAILSARDHDSEFITLLDGDCIATGDITPYLTPDRPGIMSRLKSTAEDAGVFRKHYSAGEEPGGIPRKILEVWQRDVGEREIPAIRNTVIGGNLTIHRDHLDFVERWRQQMSAVLPADDTGMAYDYDSIGYFQMDESVLNSLLAFSDDAPPRLDYLFNKDKHAYVAHLGPGKPRFWELWRFDRLRYHPQIMRILNWAKECGYELPDLPWTLRAHNTPLVYLGACAQKLREMAKAGVRPFASRMRRLLAIESS